VEARAKGWLTVTGGAAFVLVLLVAIFADPKTTVRLTNDASQSLFVDCGGANPTVAPGHKVSIPMSIFNPFPCLVSEEDIGTANHAAKWFGCLRFNPLVDHATLLSQVISHVTLERCWATAPR
jgi:hypothetical protein